MGISTAEMFVHKEFASISEAYQWINRYEQYQPKLIQQYPPNRFQINVNVIEKRVEITPKSLAS